MPGTPEPDEEITYAFLICSQKLVLHVEIDLFKSFFLYFFHLFLFSGLGRRIKIRRYFTGEDSQKQEEP